MAKITKDDVLSYLETSNMLEISELIKDIEEKFNVSAAAPVAVDGAAAPDTRRMTRRGWPYVMPRSIR